MASKSGWWRIPAILLALAAVVGLLVLVMAVPPRLIHMRQPDTTGLLPADRAKIQAQFETDRTKAENDLRGTLVTMLAGVAVAAGTIVAALNFTNSRKALEETQEQNRLNREHDRDQLELTRRGQVMERFGKAIDQLGDDKLDVRMGAVYALEQIARDTEGFEVGDMHWPIVEILTAFVREHGVAEIDAEPRSEQREHDQSTAHGRVVRADTQAAITVLGRRNSARDRGQVQLSGAMLSDGDLGQAKLQGANLMGAEFKAAYLVEANLEGANLWFADLEYANLAGANLQGADLTDADLKEVWLQGANLQGAYGLTQEQLDLASGDEKTKLPPGRTIKHIDP